MKTPRDILLARHRAAEPKLDAIRQAAVAAIADRRASADQTSEQPSPAAATLLRWLSAPWRELILPSRHIWTGLATIWILIFVIHVSQRDTVSSVTGQPVRTPVVMMSWQVQQRMMNELLAERMAPTEADLPRNLAPKPRTEKAQMSAA